MLQIISKGDTFTVVPIVIKFMGIDMQVYMGVQGETKWLNSLYINNVSLSNTDPLFLGVSNLIQADELRND